jgi:hypothetical protein
VLVENDCGVVEARDQDLLVGEGLLGMSVDFSLVFLDSGKGFARPALGYLFEVEAVELLGFVLHNDLGHLGDAVVLVSHR